MKSSAPLIKKISALLKYFRFGALFCLIAISIGNSAYAGPLITDMPSGNGNTFDLTATLGFGFTVGTSDISVTQLGLLDYGNNGFISSHDVGIWTDTGTLLATVTLASGTSGTTVITTTSGDSFRFVDLLTPLTLTANTTYRTGALYTSSGDLAYQVYPASPFPVATVDTSLATLVDRAYAFGGTLQFPSTMEAGSLAIVGPNFIATPVPEPSSVALLCAGMGFGAVMIRRRMRPRM